MFSLCPPFRGRGYPVSGLDGGGEYPIPDVDRASTPSQVQVGGGTPSQVWIGGTPSCWQRGYPIPGPGGGVPHLAGRRGVPHPRSGWGYPHPRSGQEVPPFQYWMVYSPIEDWMGAPIKDWIGYPLSKTGWDTPNPDLGWGTPLPRLDGVPPWVRKQISKVSTWFAASSVPLAFMQEDFLIEQGFRNCVLMNKAVF